MAALAQSPYIAHLERRYPAFVFMEFLPVTVRPEEIDRVIYKENSTELVFKYNGKLSVAVLSTSVGQKEIIRLKREIAKRSEYLDRVENWECRDSDDFFSMDIQWRLIDSRKREGN